MTTGSPWMSAAEAARLLGVSRATLYAYVSRGYLRSQAAAGTARERSYSRDDVQRLRQRTEERRSPEQAAARALQWGMPLLESAITLIDGRRLYYRGHDATALARTRSFAEVAALIWTGRFDAPSPVLARSRRPGIDVAPDARVDRRLPFAARTQALLASAAAHDPAAFDTRAAAVVAAGWRILRLLTLAATGSQPETADVDSALARAWQVDRRGADVLRAALILCADHELNVSSFTARCVASTGSHPYAVVIAGLAALEGPKHGGAGARVAAMLAALRRSGSVRSDLWERLRRGEAIEGFGHPLYPDGDPRARALFEMLRERYGRSAEYRFVSEVVTAARTVTGEQPNVDFALAALSRVMRLPSDSTLVLFAIGRTAGWIGHAIEQYATGQLIRPRAKYVGVAPLDG